MSDKKNNAYKRFLLYLVGGFILIVGIALILAWWDDVVSLFRGFLGLSLALTGLVVLYYLNKK